MGSSRTVHYRGSTPDSAASYYLVGAYEVTGDRVRKYHAIAGQMLAVREIEGEADMLTGLLTAPLGSVVAVTDDQGALLTQQRYLPFSAERDPSGFSMTALINNAQRARAEGLGGLMDYKARFYWP